MKDLVPLPTSSNPVLEDKLNSHAVYLTLGQHGVLHKIRQHLHHGLLNGVYNQMHPVVRNKNLGVSTGSYLLFIILQKQRVQVFTHHFWVTDSMAACVHLRCSFKKCRPLTCHTLLFPPPPSAECLCLRVSQTPALREVLQSTPAAPGTRNCARLPHPSDCFVSVSHSFYGIL